MKSQLTQVRQVLEGVAVKRQPYSLSSMGRRVGYTFAARMALALDHPNGIYRACRLVLDQLGSVNKTIHSLEPSPDELLLAAAGHVSCDLAQLITDLTSCPRLTTHFDGCQVEQLLKYIHKQHVAASITDCQPAFGLVLVWMLKYATACWFVTDASKATSSNSYVGLVQQKLDEQHTEQLRQQEQLQKSKQLHMPTLIEGTELEEIVDDNFCGRVVKSMTIQAGDCLFTAGNAAVTFVKHLKGNFVGVRKGDSTSGVVCKTSSDGLRHRHCIKATIWTWCQTSPTRQLEQLITLHDVFKELAFEDQRLVSPGAVLFLVGEIGIARKEPDFVKWRNCIDAILMHVAPRFVVQPNTFWPGQCMRSSCYLVADIQRAAQNVLHDEQHRVEE